jgi:hypothetical protein
MDLVTRVIMMRHPTCWLVILVIVIVIPLIVAVKVVVIIIIIIIHIAGAHHTATHQQSILRTCIAFFVQSLSVIHVHAASDCA